MEWDLKMPSWDFTEFERDAVPETNNIGLVVLGSSEGTPVSQTNGLDCSVDLKLGGLGDIASQAKWKGEQAKVPAAGPLKRARVPSGGIQNVSCSVDGCRADLGKCRDYHRRHKVCEVHSKTPMVIVAGQEQRFCQQCSRFHMVTEFDEIKRSCRRRLEGHNKRRRKPQQDSVHYVNSFSGATVSSYSQSFPTTRPEPNWPRIVKQENPLYARQTIPHFAGKGQYLPIPNYGKEKKQFPFLQGSEINLHSTTTFGTSVDQLQTRSITNMTGSTSGSNSSCKMFNNETAQVFNSDCVLSLLSSPSQTSGAHLSHIVPSADQIHFGHAPVPSLKYGDYEQYCHSLKAKTISATGFSCLGLKNEPTGTVLVPEANDLELHCQSIFHFGDEGTSDGRSTETPFSWQ